ncbi:ALP1-like protein isoform X1 [Tanacetum coccineum]
MHCAIRQLAYGVTPDSLDEYLQMGSHTARDCLDFFTMCVIELFMPKYLRKPDFNDIQKLYTAHNNIHGFPGMLGSIDCMHWEWRNCPKAWHGQFGRGDKKYPTILLEAVASYDLWIWHAFFGVAGANNDLTVLNNSPLFDDLLDGIDPVAPFECNGVTFEKGYYLADGIYPQWASFVKSFTVASSEKNVLYKRKQEGARKDIERAFGVLQGHNVYMKKATSKALEAQEYKQNWEETKQYNLGNSRDFNCEGYKKDEKTLANYSTREKSSFSEAAPSRFANAGCCDAVDCVSELLWVADADVADFDWLVPSCFGSTQAKGPSNTDVRLPCLLVLITGTSQSRQHGKSESDSYYLSD